MLRHKVMKKQWCELSALSWYSAQVLFVHASGLILCTAFLKYAFSWLFLQNKVTFAPQPPCYLNLVSPNNFWLPLLKSTISSSNSSPCTMCDQLLPICIKHHMWFVIWPKHIINTCLIILAQNSVYVLLHLQLLTFSLSWLLDMLQNPVGQKELKIINFIQTIEEIKENLLQSAHCPKKKTQQFSGHILKTWKYIGSSISTAERVILKETSLTKM